jgi:hypothetical protein
MLRYSGFPVGAWLSLVEHLVRDQGVGGSNPLAPTFNPHEQKFKTAASMAAVFDFLGLNVATIGKFKRLYKDLKYSGSALSSCNIRH